MLKISDGVMYAAKKTNKNAIKYEIFGKSEYGFQ
jgi:hypothetical protein